MSNEYIISIDNPAKLSIKTKRLIITTTEEKSIAVKDIAILILENPYSQVSAPVFSEITQHGGIIIGVDASRMPIYMSLPIGINKIGAKRPHQQIKYVHSIESKKWWDTLISAKIHGQGKNITEFGGSKGTNIIQYAYCVKNGDENNIEGTVARVYWKEFFTLLSKNPKQARIKEGATDIINSSLNYGYAIMRGMIARGLLCAGLCLNFGIGHYRKDNPFNLVEDFIEPFRPYIDTIVFSILSSIDDNIEKRLSPDIKNLIIKEILKLEISLGCQNYRVFNAIERSIYSFTQALEDPRRNLLVPNMIKSAGKPITKKEESRKL